MLFLLYFMVHGFFEIMVVCILGGWSIMHVVDPFIPMPRPLTPTHTHTN